MKLVHCPSCKHKVSSQAFGCPQCGQPFSEQQRMLWNQKPMSSFGGCSLAVGILAIIGILGLGIALATVDWEQVKKDVEERRQIEAEEKAAAAERAAEEAARIEASKRREVSREDFADAWPLTVESGVLQNYVERVGTSAVLIHEKKTYALNGTAQSRGYQKIDTIWADNPEIPGTKISIGVLIDAALELTPSNAPGVDFEEADSQNSMAYEMSKVFVRRHLKSPTSADFPFSASYIGNDGKKRYTVKAYVDAQNSFGVALRKNYVCVLDKTEDSWELVSFNFTN